MKIAAIDLGTNSFKLLIGKVTPHHYQFLCEKRIHVKIGKDSLMYGRLSQEAQERVLAAMVDFKKIINTYEVDYIEAKATSTLRNVQNAASVIAQIRDKTGIQVAVISGEEEAELIYLGVKEAIRFGQENVLIMDIGGGSVEFIICNAQQKLWQQSFEIGAQRLLDTFHYHDPILPEEVKKLRHFCKTQLQALFNQTALYQPTRMIGSSGAFRTLVKFCKAKQKHMSKVYATASNLPLEQFMAIYHEILPTTHVERMHMLSGGTMRIDMVVVAAILIHLVVTETQLTCLDVSNYSLKVGIFIDAWKKWQHVYTSCTIAG